MQYGYEKIDLQHVLLQDPCLETYDSDQEAPLPSAGAGSAHFSQSLLVQQSEPAAAHGSRVCLGNPPYQAGIDSTMMGNGKQSMHSPDASGTLTGPRGSGPCSDASDLTSTNPSDLPMNPHKRAKLGSAEPAQLTAMCHASAQPDPNLSTWSSSADVFAQQQGLPLTGGSLKGSLPGAMLFSGSLSPPSVARSHLVELPRQAVDKDSAPPYTPCTVLGLTAAQEALKAEQETQLAEALRRQENMVTAGYEMDDFGALHIPPGQYTRMLSMKVVFAQRWQREAQAAAPADVAPMSMKQLLLYEAVQLESEQALSGEGLLQHGDAQLPSQSGASAPIAHAKPLIKFKLSEVKNAMRKAELGGPEMSSTLSGNHASGASDARHTAWQVDQFSNTPLLNKLWAEYHIERCNLEFDDSYWSMLENLST